MDKFNQKVHDLTLEVGGSHYPSINPHLHQKLVKMVVEECLSAMDDATKQHVLTTYDLDRHLTTIENAKNAIKERFGL